VSDYRIGTKAALYADGLVLWRLEVYATTVIYRIYYQYGQMSSAYM